MPYRVQTDHHKQDKTEHPLRPVWYVAKAWGYGGYDYYAMTDDGALLCRTCVKAEYRQVVAATMNRERNGWRVLGVQCSGDMHENEPCAHCGKSLGPNEED
jgi:hypothetical protein